MESNSSYNKHFIALSALFVLGNGVITAPAKSADKFNFLSFMIACVLAVAVYFAMCFIPFNKVTVIAVTLLAFYCTADAFIIFIKFINYDLLSDIPRFLIVLPIAVILIYIAFQKRDVLLKFSLFCFFITVAVILFFFLSTLKDFNLKNIYIYELPTVTSIFKQIIPYIKDVVLPVGLLSFFASQEKIKKSSGFVGICMGLLLFAICVLNSVLLFGIEFSAALDYPYSSAGSTVTFGNLFTRLDGLLHIVYMASCVVKCTVGILVIKKSRNKLVP